jgi:rare lipoprotein A
MMYPQIISLNTRNLLVLLIAVFSLSSCARKITETGKASYYADKFEGRKTSSGEVFKQGKMTAAHRTLPFGTKVKVVNLANGRSVKVTINDRGPFAAGRVIDLSKKAARKLGMVDAGVASVEIRYKKKKK